MGKEDKLMRMIQHKDASDKSTNRQPNTRTEAVHAEEEKQQSVPRKMPAEDGPNNQRKPDNRAHEQKKQQPTESIYLKSENEKKERTKLVRSKKRRSENVWENKLTG